MQGRWRQCLGPGRVAAQRARQVHIVDGPSSIHDPSPGATTVQDKAKGTLPAAQGDSLSHFPRSASTSPPGHASTRALGTSLAVICPPVCCYCDEPPPSRSTPRLIQLQPLQARSEPQKSQRNQLACPPRALPPPRAAHRQPRRYYCPLSSAPHSPSHLFLFRFRCHQCLWLSLEGPPPTRSSARGDRRSNLLLV